MKNWMRWLAGGTVGATLAILGLIASVVNAKVDPPGAVALAVVIGFCGGATLMYVAMDVQNKRAESNRILAELSEKRGRTILDLQAQCVDLQAQCDSAWKACDEARMASLQEVTVREQRIAALQAENARLHSIRTTHKGAGKK